MSFKMKTKLVIEFCDGQITVNGPINDKILCFGMLEAAKDAVRTHIEKPGPALIVPVSPIVEVNQ